MSQTKFDSARLVSQANYLEAVNSKLKSHSFLASSSSLAKEPGSAWLLSIKYPPETPLTLGFNAK